MEGSIPFSKQFSYAAAVRNSVPETKKNESKEINRELFSFPFYSCVGSTVKLALINGEVYDGILSATLDEEGIILLKARLRTSKDEPVKLTSSVKIIDSLKTVGAAQSRGNSFAIDTEISRKTSLGEKELMPWLPDADDGSNLFSLDDDRSSSTQWDQFEVNERLFGVRSSFDEEFYTTKLDRNSDSYKKNLHQAERIAFEIKSGNTSNVHLAEERGHAVGRMDEEDRYGAVLRPRETQAQNRYLPPHRRTSDVEEKPVSSTNITELKPTAKTFVPRSTSLSPQMAQLSLQRIIRGPSRLRKPMLSSRQQTIRSYYLSSFRAYGLREIINDVDEKWPGNTLSFRIMYGTLAMPTVPPLLDPYGFPLMMLPPSPTPTQYYSPITGSPVSMSPHTLKDPSILAVHRTPDQQQQQHPQHPPNLPFVHFSPMGSPFGPIPPSYHR